MDMGYGFELQTTKFTGLLVIFGSFILTVAIYLIGKFFLIWTFQQKSGFL